MYMAGNSGFRSVHTGTYLGKSFSGNWFGGLKWSKAGQWEECSVALHGLANVPDEIQKRLPEIAAMYIIPALDETKLSGDFAPNAPLTISLKGHSQPWVGDGSHVTGHAELNADAKAGVVVHLSGDQTVISAVNDGYYNVLFQREVEGRDLFGQAWDSCRDQVEQAVQELVDVAFR